MVKQAGVGDLEMELVSYVSERGPVRVRQAVEEFGAERELARTTVATMLDRLCQKGVLQRSKQGRFYVYELKVPMYQVLKGLMHRFFQRTLGGSLTPLVTYLSEEREYSDEELEELKALVEELERRKQEERD